MYLYLWKEKNYHSFDYIIQITTITNKHVMHEKNKSEHSKKQNHNLQNQSNSFKVHEPSRSI